MKRFLTSRREALAAFCAAVAMARDVDSSGELVFPSKRSLIVHNDRPEDLESPVAYLNQWLTPVDSFFVRQHLPRP
ncbi:MAG: hypothetical protein ACJ74Y_02495, partial [Bryobacteraceae bacterium]